MKRAACLLLLAALSTGGCGWFGERTVPDAVTVPADSLGVVIDTPRGWTARPEPDLGRVLFFVGKEGDRNHAVILQKLSAHKTWRAHADHFRENQEHALDKIQSESEHEIREGGVVFRTRQQREGRPVVNKLRYYVEIGDDTYLLDMAAPQAEFDAGLYTAVAKTLRPASP